MRLLLDTHIALWSVTADPKLPAAARSLIADFSNTVSVSVASLWEIAIKHATKRRGAQAMPLNARLAASYFTGSGFQILTASAAHIFAIEDLELLHADPFDRLILAQASAEGMTLLTSDAVLAKYPGDVRKV
ncbi:MAG: type II toxin-antitoxin system VapC family toxin [Parvularculaceae bacterium]